MPKAEEAKALYRQMVNIHSAHTRVKAICNTFPKRDKKDIPQNAPERRLRHICERFENELAQVTLDHFDAVRADILSRKKAA